VIDPAVEAELEAALAPIRAAHPGISNGEVAEMLPEHLRQPLWERAIGRYLETELANPEVELFNKYTPKLREMEYGSPEYRESLEGLRPALEHHYANNRHHPEHHADGVGGMTLVDLIEMLADWKASTERMSNGDLRRSLEINSERFGLPPQLVQILANTAQWFGWLDKPEETR
jgi:hypothetical protein